MPPSRRRSGNRSTSRHRPPKDACASALGRAGCRGGSSTVTHAGLAQLRGKRADPSTLSFHEDRIVAETAERPTPIAPWRSHLERAEETGRRAILHRRAESRTAEAWWTPPPRRGHRAHAHAGAELPAASFPHCRPGALFAKLAPPCPQARIAANPNPFFNPAASSGRGWVRSWFSSSTTCGAIGTDVLHPTRLHRSVCSSHSSGGSWASLRGRASLCGTWSTPDSLSGTRPHPPRCWRRLPSGSDLRAATPTLILQSVPRHSMIA